MSAMDRTARIPGRQEAKTMRRLLMSAQDAARALAISERTLWGLTKRQAIPSIRVGRRVLYDPRDLQAWINRQKAKAPRRPAAGSVEPGLVWPKEQQ